jgi:glycosyltransferase involved in cell wall biosynthesis
MKKAPFLSIVIPTFNSEQYLPQCLASLVSQTIQDFEIIVVDKQSSDATLEIIDSYNLPDLQVLSQVTNSLPEALDEGFRASKGTLLCWLNSDDAYARPDALEIIQKNYIKHPRSDRFIYASHLCINDESNIISLNTSHWPTSQYERALGGMNLCTGALFFSQNLYKSLGGLGKQYKLSFEYVLIDFLFLNGKPVFVPCYVHAYRLHGNQLSHQSSDIMESECLEISAMLPQPNNAAILVWFCKRVMARLLYSNPIQRRKWRGKPLAKYWREHDIKSQHQSRI